LDIVQFYGHIIGISLYTRSGERGGRKVVGKEGKDRRRKEGERGSVRKPR